MSTEMIDDSVQRIFSDALDRGLVEDVERGGFPEDLWKRVVASGFHRILCREDDGGIEATWEESFPIFYQIGYRQVPLPLAETIIANFVLSAAGVSVGTEEPVAVLDVMSDGTRMKLDAEGATCSGAACAVAWARHADRFLVALPDNRIALVSKGKGVRIRECADVAGMPADEVEFAAVPVDHVFANPFADIGEPLRTFGAAARAAMIVGALEFALDQSVSYAKDRVQFGRPIGKNQAIQQQLAAMAGDVAVARAAALTGFRDLPSVNERRSPRAEFSVACAKVCAGEAVSQGTSIAHQVHGAIGFTSEHQLNFATRRLWAWRGQFGTAAWWAGRIGRSFIRSGSERLWENLTARTLPAMEQTNA